MRMKRRMIFYVCESERGREWGLAGLLTVFLPYYPHLTLLDPHYLPIFISLHIFIIIASPLIIFYDAMVVLPSFLWFISIFIFSSLWYSSSSSSLLSIHLSFSLTLFLITFNYFIFVSQFSTLLFVYIAHLIILCLLLFCSNLLSFINTLLSIKWWKVGCWVILVLLTLLINTRYSYSRCDQVLRRVV